MSIKTKNSNLIKQIVKRELSENTRSIFQIEGKGIVNQVFIVQTDLSKVIVRINAAPGTFEMYQKEKWCIEQSALQDIPGPDVLAIGQIDQVVYMIQTYITGKNADVTLINKAEIWWKLGEYTRRVHTIPTNGFGDILTDSNNGTFRASTHDGFNGTWHSFIQYNINSLTSKDPLIELGVLSNKDTKNVKRNFEKLLEEHFEFGLNHGDLSLQNTMVDDEGKIFLLDWGSAGVQVKPYWDVIQLIKRQVTLEWPKQVEINAFLEGYGLEKNSFPHWESNLESLLLLDAFDKLRWAIDCQPDRIPFFVTYAKQLKKRIQIL
jgi:aminoglycoside phosphotransferase (APT) family kinase protein